MAAAMTRGFSEEQVRGIGMTSQRTRDRLVERLRAKGIDNEAVLEIEVESPPDGVELEVTVEDLSVVPETPSELPTQLAVFANVRNLGTASADQVRVLIAVHLIKRFDILRRFASGGKMALDRQTAQRVF